MEKVELLAPAKNAKALKAALPHADSVYFGVHGLNMRARADNFHVRDLPEVVATCHARDVKCYLATNILVYEPELPYLRQTLEAAKAAGIDAVIVHDLAAIQYARELGLPFHVSTQCNVSNSVAARFYESLGAERIILARELDLTKIREVKAALATAEVEVFVHGAMCTSISGRCYFSQDVNGSAKKSANRGNCTQPCRQRWWVRGEGDNEYIYDGTRFMNSRDLCTIAHVPELVEARVDAFKIEGRMRDAHYVDTVTRVYREAIEAHYAGTFSEDQVGRWVTALKREYNRGFTTGFLFGLPTVSDHQHNAPSNLSHYRLIEIGHVQGYDTDSQLATIQLTNGKLACGMDVVVEGPDTDTYFRQKVRHLYRDGSVITKTATGRRHEPVTAQLAMKAPVLDEGRDRVYVFTNRTYANRKKRSKRGRRNKRGKPGRPRQKRDYYRMPD